MVLLSNVDFISVIYNAGAWTATVQVGASGSNASAETPEAAIGQAILKQARMTGGELEKLKNATH
jgi:hypothetical protein